MKKNDDDILGIKSNFDIKAETLAAALLAQTDGEMDDLGIEQIILAPTGSAKRRSGNDVDVIKKKYFDQDTAILIQLNRKGLFDTLPAGLFLRLDEEYKSPKARTKAIEQQIKDARKFFLPYEQAMYHPKIEGEQIEQKYTEGFPSFIHDIWGLDRFSKELSERQKFLLCYLIPESYRVVGDWNLTGLIFEAVLQTPVDLNFKAPKFLEIPNNNLAASEMKLGENSIMGDAFRDEVPSVDVVVKGVTYSDLPDYLPEGKKRRILEELLCSYFMPLDVPFEIKVVVTRDSLNFNLGEAVLGYNVQFV